MFGRISRPSALLAAALAAASCASDFAWADACDNAVKGSNRKLIDETIDFTKHFTMGSLDKAESARDFCNWARKAYEQSVTALPLMRRAEAACGSRLRTECNSACIESRLPGFKADMIARCAEADRLNQPVEKLKSVCLRGYLDDDERARACGGLAAAEAAAPEDRAKGYLYVAGKGDRASEMKNYNDALRVHPGDEDALLRRGLLYNVQNQPDLALKDFSDGIAANPKSGKLRVARARIYEGRKAYDQAIAELTDAIAFSSPDDVVMVYDQRARDHMYKGDYKQALAEYQALAAKGDMGKMVADMGIDAVKEWQQKFGPK